MYYLRYVDEESKITVYDSTAEDVVEVFEKKDDRKHWVVEDTLVYHLDRHLKADTNLKILSISHVAFDEIVVFIGR